MRAVVLLSAGIDPVSGRPAPVGTEIRAIGLARALGARAIGLHAGLPVPVLREYAGYGLADIVCLDGAGADPVTALARAILSGGLFAEGPVDLVLAGRRASGGADSGLLPYAVAERLGWPIVADVAAAQRATPAGPSPELEIEQARPRGARRTARVAGPCVLSVHEVAACVPDFVFAQARAAVLRTMPAGIDGSPPLAGGAEERAYRRRPRLIAAAAQASGGRVLVDPAPQDAARAIIDHLRALGVLPPPAGS
ncbi:electron transfer flavoprotein subunit beta [Gluconacetobacter azotocaptans]|uniref:Electron transfer flavoprotein subunit beta n=1 Tax=Gluconacetobacter azotocaptans TaxID=142834 RepID=A0A7W4PER4_9PROT|nr:electron transfer flavoprotein subunit beta [Gluconacetobacter azotocaptans]MBM9400710.1 electron transfer flavoprotein subunit beta [Gluconacetobacter azotocaptans]